jgi:hypothetical protein
MLEHVGLLPGALPQIAAHRPDKAGEQHEHHRLRRPTPEAFELVVQIAQLRVPGSPLVVRRGRICRGMRLPSGRDVHRENREHRSQQEKLSLDGARPAPDPNEARHTQDRGKEHRHRQMQTVAEHQRCEITREEPSGPASSQQLRERREHDEEGECKAERHEPHDEKPVRRQIQAEQEHEQARLRCDPRHVHVEQERER